MIMRTRDAIAERAGRPIDLVAYASKDPPRDATLDLSKLRKVDDPVALARDPGIDVFVELMGGEGDPAKSSVEAALGIGQPVVTANKALLAHHGVALAKLAEANKTTLSFEAAVAGGIPIVKTLREGLGGSRINRIYGILNGTCNYILTRMQKERLSFDACLKEAQKLGYAEADPTFDIGGFDTAHKIAILTSLAFGTEVDAEAVHVEGIESITLADLEAADELGYRVKLLGVAQRTDAGIEQRVHPTMVPKGNVIAEVDGVLNAVAIDADTMELTLMGPGAGGAATVVGGRRRSHGSCRRPARAVVRAAGREPRQGAARAMQRHEGGYYIRLAAVDRPGTAATIARRMAEANISLESIMQRGRDRRPHGGDDPRSADKPAPVALITYATTEDAVRRALAAIEAGRRRGREAAGDPHRERADVLMGNRDDESVDHRPAGSGAGAHPDDRDRARDRARGGLGGAAARPRRRKRPSDQAAVDAMRRELNKLPIDGTVVIGEGELDEAPMLFIGEKVGNKNGPKVDIAVDPLEGTTLCAKNMPGAIATVAMADDGTLLHAPDVYMEKIAIGPGYPKGVVDLDAPAEENILNLAKAKGVQAGRDHRAAARSAAPRRPDRGRAQGRRLGPPDHAMATSPASSTPPNPSTTGIDIYLGIGGAPEGVLAAAALRCIGGQMQCRLVLDTEERRERALKMGITDPRKRYEIEDMVQGDCLFAATGVTTGAMLRGVRFRGDIIETETVVMRSVTGTVRWIRAEHRQLEKFHLD